MKQKQYIFLVENIEEKDIQQDINENQNINELSEIIDVSNVESKIEVKNYNVCNVIFNDFNEEELSKDDNNYKENRRRL